MSKEVFSPNGLSTVATSRRERDLAYFSTACPQIPESLTSERAASTLVDFSNELSGPRLTEIMSFYRKEGRTSDSSTFFLKPILKKYSVSVGNEGWGRFYMDTHRGLALGVRSPRSRNTLWLGVAGIALGNELDEYNPEHNIRKGRMNFPYQFPVIAQLQGPDKFAYSHRPNGDVRYRRALEVLNSYKWERAMIDIVLQWAQEQQAPAAYILPANLNRWLTDRRADQFKMRYDVSAERTGFRMQPNGLYGISLLPFPSL